MAAKKDTRKITVTATSTAVKKPSNKTLKPGSMASNPKLVPDNLAKKKASTSYSPAPMSAAAKAKAKAAGAKKQAATKNPMGLKALKNDKPARGAKSGTSLVSKVVGRAKTVAREVRDIPTAVGTVARATVAGKPKSGTNTPPNKQATYAKYDLKKQLKQVGSAIKSGKTGTPAVRYGKDKPKR